MILKLTSIIAVLLFTTSSFGQKFVTIQDLNIREGQGANFKVLGIVPKDSEINILEINGSWGKLSLDSGYGFVSVKFLQPVKNNSTKSEQDHLGVIGWATAIIVVILSIFFKGNRIIASNNSSTRSTQSKQQISTQLYHCKRCGEKQLVEVGKYPISRALCNDGKVHKWGRLY